MRANPLTSGTLPLGGTVEVHQSPTTLILRVESGVTGRLSYLDIDPADLPGVIAALSEADLIESRKG